MKMQKIMYWVDFCSKPQIGVAVLSSFDASGIIYIIGEDGERLTVTPHDCMLVTGPLSYIDTDYKAH